ncbi:hypothetical protein [Aeromicrobium sp. CTD01-1L150]|uniref:hypothetical protein n=1 Tax=Aeromicrobium sp. CTD01-1L150 TaxID=3341830 RepID=UPI0035BFF475
MITDPQSFVTATIAMRHESVRGPRDTRAGHRFHRTAPPRLRRSILPRHLTTV